MFLNKRVNNCFIYREFNIFLASKQIIKLSNKIDEINILNASLLAMKRAILMLKKKPVECYVDGLYAPKIEGWNLTAMIKGDSLIPSISAASIVAKVERDKYMESLHELFPQYELNSHKGYPTKKHISLIKKFGVNKIYRKTFKPVKDLI